MCTNLIFLRRCDVTVMSSAVSLTDSGLCAGEAAVLRYQVRIVALAGNHLQHLTHLLTTTFTSSPEHPKTDVRPITGELPPGRRKRSEVMRLLPHQEIKVMT